MLKDMNDTYYDTQKMYKCKKSERWTMIVTGFKAGNGKYAGLVGSLEIGFYDPELKKATPLTFAGGLSDEQRRGAKENPNNWLGKTVEIEAQEKTKTGALRHKPYERS